MEEKVGTDHNVPLFGDPSSPAEDVFAFYKYWANFTTNKKFAFVDSYNPNHAPNRRVKRIIEGENQKERNKERKEFNSLVQQLVEYVKKRDPRYQKFHMEEVRAKEAKKRMEEEEREKKRMEEQEKIKKYREEMAQKYAEEEKRNLETGNYEEVFEEEFGCSICKKSFKKEKVLQDHLKSKKHKE